MLDNYKPHYLTPVVTQFLMLIQEMKVSGHSKLTFDLSVCNADHDPASYTEATNLRKYVHVFDIFNKTTTCISRKLTERRKKNRIMYFV